MSDRYKHSEALLEKTRKLIPLASQTFSKSITQLPFGVSPYFVDHAKGSHFWDVDGNEYIDFVNGLACVTLGYCDPDVDAAVLKQMKNGVTFSLPHTLEMEVAELLVDMIPCAEKVRFAKNGSDATSGAIRVARAYTGRERVAACGYHGWHDWYIGGTSRDLGVPVAVKNLIHYFTYNDISSLAGVLESHPGEFAAVIMEPMNVFYPENDFLNEVRNIAHAHGALLIFDETITGFRFSEGGAQKEFGVIPDLATFGKGIANGYPLSALVGNRELMDVVERIFFSGTFGGETLSLAAAKACLMKIRQSPVLQTIHEQGQKIIDGLKQILVEYELESHIKVSGHPSWSFIIFGDVGRYTTWDLKTFFIQEVFQRGVYTLGTHNMSFAHSDTDIETLMEVYHAVFGEIHRGLLTETLSQMMKCRPLIPLFKVR